MYGLVNQAVEELALAQGGSDCWRAICKKAGVGSEGFISMNAYPDEITYKLIAAGSEVLDMPADQLLRAFGRHWVLFTGKEGYGCLMRRSGRNLVGFLKNLDTLHTRVGLTMPQLRPPSFVVDEPVPGQIILRYHSERQGLAPMVIGLLEGLGEMFSPTVTILHTVDRMEAGYDEFFIQYSSTGGE
jgi:hypothetical protein